MEQYIAVMTRKTVNILFYSCGMCRKSKCVNLGHVGWIIIHKGAFCFHENDL